MEDNELRDIWDNYKPYHEGERTRSFLVDGQCIHLTQSVTGEIYQE